MIKVINEISSTQVAKSISATFSGVEEDISSIDQMIKDLDNGNIKLSDPKTHAQINKVLKGARVAMSKMLEIIKQYSPDDDKSEPKDPYGDEVK